MANFRALPWSFFRTKIAFLALLGLSVACNLSLNSCRGRKKASTAQQNRPWQRPDAGKPLNTPLTSAELSQIITTARSFTGTPYMNGGTTRAGMDCSGLTQAAYQSVGRTLPRSSNEQSVIGRLIQSTDLKQGDLVFFTDRKGNTRITHVGMVTEVESREKIKFIHATNSLGVVENNLKQPYWYNLFLKAIRVGD